MKLGVMVLSLFSAVNFVQASQVVANENGTAHDGGLLQLFPTNVNDVTVNNSTAEEQASASQASRNLVLSYKSKTDSSVQLLNSIQKNQNNQLRSRSAGANASGSQQANDVVIVNTFMTHVQNNQGNNNDLDKPASDE